jgi:ribonuclease P protein component
MLPKKRRIPRKDFVHVLTKGKRFTSPSLLLYMAKIDAKNGLEPSKFSFSVSKKVCPKAVGRNKHRRRGYSIVSGEISRIKPGFYCFFSVKKTNKPISFDVFKHEVKELLSVSGMLI